jgi:hypothetical protein
MAAGFPTEAEHREAWTIASTGGLGEIGAIVGRVRLAIAARTEVTHETISLAATFGADWIGLAQQIKESGEELGDLVVQLDSLRLEQERGEA